MIYKYYPPFFVFWVIFSWFWRYLLIENFNLWIPVYHIFFFLWYQVGIQFYCFVRGYPFILASSIERTVHSCLDVLGSYNSKCNSWFLNSVFFSTWMSVVMRVSHHLDICRFIEHFKIGKCEFSSIFLFCFFYMCTFKIADLGLRRWFKRLRTYCSCRERPCWGA